MYKYFFYSHFRNWLQNQDYRIKWKENQTPDMVSTEAFTSTLFISWFFVLLLWTASWRHFVTLQSANQPNTPGPSVCPYELIVDNSLHVKYESSYTTSSAYTASNALCTLSWPQASESWRLMHTSIRQFWKLLNSKGFLEQIKVTEITTSTSLCL